MKVVEEPLGRGRDEGAVADVAGQRPIGGVQDAGVVAQPRKDAAGMAALRIERVMGREGERSLVEPLGAQRFVTKGLFAVEVRVRGCLKQQGNSLPSKISASPAAAKPFSCPRNTNGSQPSNASIGQPNSYN
jgi:hypothetical protein